MIREPNVVLLHGFGTSSHLWRHVAEDLAGVRPLHPDLPGFGSCAQQPGFSVSEMADAVEGHLTRAGFEQFVLVGHSMGAKVAVALASRAPRGLRGLGLIAPSPPAGEPMTPEVRERVRALWDDAQALRAYYPQITRAPLEARDLDNLVQDGLRASQQAWNAWLDRGSREDCSPAARAVQVPTLVIASREDPVIPLATVEREIAPLFRDAQLSVLEGSGHLLPLEAPKQVTRALLHWMNRLEERP